MCHPTDKAVQLGEENQMQPVTYADTQSVISQTNCVINCSSRVDQTAAQKGMYKFLQREKNFYSAADVAIVQVNEFSTNFLLKDNKVISHYVEGPYPFSSNRVTVEFKMAPQIEISDFYFD